MKLPNEHLHAAIADCYRRFYAAPGLRSDIQLPALPSELPKAVVERLAAYVELLLHWNETIDLIAPADAEQVLDRHILDSLVFSLLMVPAGGNLLDIGTGAGLPGIVCAVVRPEIEVILCEPRKKRCVFLREAKRMLALAKVEVFEGKLEQLERSAFSLLTCRALGQDRLILDNSKKLLSPEGRVALMVGPSWSPPSGESPGVLWRGTVDYVLPLDHARRAVAVWDVSRETYLN